MPTETTAGDVWMTLEHTPRKLTVRGQSAIDPDCLVAYEEGSASPLWIVIGSNLECFVCGLGVRAVRKRTETTEADKEDE